MTGRILVRVSALALAFLWFGTGATFAQSGIVGVVRDTTGAVLPGVTVEASSPALIEKVRSVVTDDQGLYRIVDLRPGDYVVTFALAGFNTVRREGLELPASFTATVNAELRVGALEETVTVTGQTPVVDVQTVSQQQVFSKDLLESLPTNRTPQGVAAYLPGVTGGLNVAGVESRSMAIHGTRAGENSLNVDGMSDSMALGPGGGNSTFYINPVNVQELSVAAGGHKAEIQMAGLWSNVIPKEGSNTFSGTLYGAYADDNMASSNLSERLKARGVTAVAGTKRLWDFSPAIGGRILRDKLWFFSSYRNSDLYRFIAGLHYNKNPKGWEYIPDLNRPAVIRNTDGSYQTRLTWQATPRNKISLGYELQPHIVWHRMYSSTVSLEATQWTPYTPNYFTQAVWKSPISARILLEAGVAATDNDYNGRRQIDPAVDFHTVSATELSTGMVFRSSLPTGAGYGERINRAVTTRASASYITGSHDLKVGFSIKQGTTTTSVETNGDMGVILRNAVPTSLSLIASTYRWKSRINADLGVYAQDQWTVRRLTLNLGLRYDYFNSEALAQHLDAQRWVGPRDFAAVKNVPNWHDISPRVGASYDLFGDGKTALKWFLNRYVAGTGTGLATNNHPVNTSVTTVTRTWGDANRDYVPDCDLINPAANGECGRISDLNFGQANPRATTYDDDVLHGYGKRGYNWETSAALQRELLAGVSMNATYVRRWYGNFTATDNVLVAPADYSSFCVTAPRDPRLPEGGGNQQCGFADISSAKFGQVTNLITFAKNFGKQSEVYTGVDFAISARLPRGAQISGGVSMGSLATNSCFVIDSPQQLKFCDVTTPFQPNVKAVAVYPLPWWSLQTSLAFQSVPGPQITAQYPATNAEIRPSLGRDLSAGANGTALVELIEPGTLFDAQVNQLDFRVAKNIRIGRARFQAMFDVFNLFNSSDIQTLNVRYGSAWLQPRLNLDARLFKVSGQIDF
jgi:hypothetical protein